MALNVLVVDDSAIMRQMIVRTLTMSGIPLGEIHQAANGQEGLEVLEQNWIDLVLVDINMPVMNGQEMIEKAREQPDLGDLAIIVVSTDGSATRLDMMQRHNARFVQKPFTPETLRDRILEAMGATYEQLTGSGTGSGDSPDF